MNRIDPRGGRVTGATASALPRYEGALAAFVSWRSGAELALAQALKAAPRFVMARVLKAHLLLGSGDRARRKSARALLHATAAMPADEHERMHLAAVAHLLADDAHAAAALLGAALQARPRDLLALAVACGIDHATGESARMRERIEAALPAWSPTVPGHHHVLAMHAFALAECGNYRHAEDAARAALYGDAGDARAHHAMAHVFEMTDRPEAGVRWMNEHVERWGTGTVVATHGWWHLALFHLARDEPGIAMAIYDRRIRAGGSAELADLMDASALLWRLHLRGVDAGVRWTELAAAWEPRIEDGHCSFCDVHAMLAFVGARDAARAQRLERVLAQRQTQPTRHGRATRRLGLPASRALMAFGRGDHPLAIALFAGLPTRLHGLGGSHAQRDVLHLTLLRAIENVRRPAREARPAQSAPGWALA
ncbi:MAG TPA: tetratricopeptide repeat protein [Methylibium sp.]|uniref:tetratricopeptide repeat protein n=1 Tax=Methylibium sp. TaxID=2067992 RepID=UPI002DBB9810|nr:tetratricopeptide repeat protein [Methylibium sp.]HEU4457789.1 tetratricopeptide repeat protein [Methylibium sp.]